MRVVVTRPEPQASQTRRRLERAGLSALVVPLLEREVVPGVRLDPGGSDFVALTSRSGALAVAASRPPPTLLARPVFAAGDATAAAARAAGFREARSAEGDAGALARAIVQAAAGRPARVLHLSGEHQAADLAAMLAPHGIVTERRVIYRMRAVDVLPEALATALGANDADAVLLYSPRSAAIYADLVAANALETPARRLIYGTLSAAIAEPLREAGFPRIAVAAAPNEAALIDALMRAKALSAR